MEPVVDIQPKSEVVVVVVVKYTASVTVPALGSLRIKGSQHITNVVIAVIAKGNRNHSKLRTVISVQEYNLAIASFASSIAIIAFINQPSEEVAIKVAGGVIAASTLGSFSLLVKLTEG